MSKQLDEARKYEEICRKGISPQERPVFHVTPAVGWLNDPNGFSIYKGEYHLFYQYHPYDVIWGPMHWGHLKSKDMIRWEYLPAAMAPDEEYDAAGVFSGSALELKDGRQLLMYTGVSGTIHTVLERQKQCIAIGDGLNYEKYEGNPVLTEDDTPEGSNPKDFRDPKIWYDEEEECFYAVVVSRGPDKSGQVLLYSSSDGLAWKFVTVLDECRNEYGKMWECPDMFQLGGKTFITVSPMEMQAKGLEFHCGNDVICLVGDYDKKTHTFTREEVHAVDYGLDFYAPQTLETPDGRRVMIAWMQSWEGSHFHPDYAKWMGQLTLPRELTVVDGRLRQNPIREFLAYRKNPVIYKDEKVSGRREFAGIGGRVLDMTVDVRPDEAESLYHSIVISFAQDEKFRTTLTYKPRRGTVCIDRIYSGFRYNIVSKREAYVRDQGGRIRLRIILDRFSAEVFVNDGEQAMASCIYTPQSADGISFEVRGSALVDIEKYEVEV